MGQLIHGWPPMTLRRTYTREDRAGAVGLAITVGARAAGRQLGIPYRNVARWMAAPEAQVIVARSRQDVADRLWAGIDQGVESVLEGLKDPKQRLSDRAQALRVLTESHALLTGGPTANNRNLNLNMDLEDKQPPHLSWEEERDLAAWLEGQLDTGRDPAELAGLFARELPPTEETP